MKQIVGFLRKIALFRSLKPAEINALAKSVQVRSFPKKALIFGKGDRGKHLYIVLSGRVKISSHSKAKMGATFAYLRRGDFFGDMAMLSTQPRSAHATAVDDTELLLLPKRDFTRLLSTNVPFSSDLVHILSERLRRANKQLEALLFQNILGRLSRMLYDLAVNKGQKMKNGILIGADYSRQELADLIGTTREPLSRALTVLRRAQLVRLQEDGIFLPDIAKLAMLAGIGESERKV